MVRFFNERKGFGFIIRPGAPDLFVHASALGRIDPAELTDGRAVSYSVEQGRNGEQAASIALAARGRVVSADQRGARRASAGRRRPRGADGPVALP